MTESDYPNLPSDIPEDILHDLSLVEADFYKGAFLSGFRNWAESSDAPAPDPRALLQADGISDRGFVNLGTFNLRSQYIAEFGFSVPTPGLIARLASLGPILEVGAGTGYLARLIHNAGGDIIATDPNSEPMNRTWFDLLPLNAQEAIAQLPNRLLLSSWPSLGETWLTEAVLALPAGTPLIVIGEGPGGCTASDCFFDLIGPSISHEPEILQGADVWRFPSIHDSAQSFRRL